MLGAYDRAVDELEQQVLRDLSPDERAGLADGLMAAVAHSTPGFRSSAAPPAPGRTRPAS